MNVTLRQESPSERILEIAVDGSRLKKALEGVFKKRAKKLKVEGFRQGKVPASVARRYLTDAVLMGEAVNLLVPQVYKEAIKQESLSPLGQADVNLIQSEAGKDLIFEAKLHVMPLFDIAGYRGFSVDSPRKKISANEVKETLLQSLEPFASYLAKAKSAVSKKGDYAFLDYRVFRKGREVPRAAVRNFQLKLQAGSFLEGLPEALIGLKAGGEKSIELTLPQNYADPGLAGKAVRLEVTIHEIRERKLPVLDDEFVQKNTKAKSLKELKASIRDRLQAQSDKARQDEIIAHIIKSLLPQISPEMVPDQLREGHVRLALRRQTQELAQRGMTIESYISKMGLAPEAYSQEIAISAMIQARLEILYRSIAFAEDLQVTNGEVDQKIVEQANRLGQKANKLKKQLVDEDRYKLLGYQILIEKVRNLLFEESQIVDPSKAKAKAKTKKTSKAKAKTKTKKTSKAKAKAKTKKASKAKAKTKTKKTSKAKAKTKTKKTSKAKAKTKTKKTSKAKAKAKTKKSSKAKAKPRRRGLKRRPKGLNPQAP